jgi:hypothetical protein
MMGKLVAALRRSKGEDCVVYPTLGAAKLSRGNPGPWCFACEERHVAAELDAVAAEPKYERSRKRSGARKTNRTRRSRGNRPKEPICMKPSCGRLVAERDGIAVVCREHAEEGRAVAVRECCRAWVLTCERAVRAAIASGDQRLERRWANLLLVAEVSFAEAEANLRLFDTRARSTTATKREERIPTTG